MKERLYGRFQSPSKAYRGKPFWSWNGKLDKDEHIRLVHVIQEMGFGGHFMHSRRLLMIRRSSHGLIVHSRHSCRSCGKRREGRTISFGQA